MGRDLRQTPLYREIEEHFRKALEPGFGSVTAIADVDVSPDGAWIAFTGTRLEALEDAPSGRVFLAETAGGGPQQLTAGPNEDRLARWSPDGSRIAFLSDRQQQGRFQAYLLESGWFGEAVALLEVEGTIESLAWSPSGQRLLFVAAGVGADQAGASGSGATKTVEDLPSWMPLVEGVEENKWRQLWVLELRTRQARRIGDRTNVWEATWAGEDSIAAVASDAPGEDAWYDATLRLIDAGSGAQRELVTSDVQLGVPVASPDGARVAVIEALCSDRIILAGRLLLVDTADGSTTPVDTEAVDVTDVAWCQDDSLLVAGLRGMDTVVARIDPAGSFHEQWSTSQGCGLWLPQARPVDHDAFALVLDSHEHPPQLTIVRGGKAETLYTLDHDGTRYLAGSLGRLEPITWTAPDGLQIEGLLTVPDGPGPHALVVVVHGGPVSASTNRWPRHYVHPLMARGYAVLQPNPRGSSGRGRAFAEMVVGDMGGADARDVLAGIDALVDRGIVDAARIGVTGGSYGGFMSCWLPTIDQRFAAAVALSPVTDWYSQHFDSNIGMWDRWFLGGEPTDDGGPYRDRSPVMRANRVRTPTLLTAGLNDRCTPPGQAMEFYRALRAHGVDSEVVLYPEEGHGVRKFPAAIDVATRMVAWFERFMPPNPRQGSS
ncbi:MAG TPA: S9 family peptidase [Candidatus Limnocylindrales bacterium]|nr:S9 family peptidase [Candidatus Limnocylindrales bacterium]